MTTIKATVPRQKRERMDRFYDAVPDDAELDEQYKAYRGRAEAQVWMAADEFVGRYCNWERKCYKNGGVR